MKPPFAALACLLAVGPPLAAQAADPLVEARGRLVAMWGELLTERARDPRAEASLARSMTDVCRLLAATEGFERSPPSPGAWAGLGAEGMAGVAALCAAGAYTAMELEDARGWHRLVLALDQDIDEVPFGVAGVPEAGEGTFGALLRRERLLARSVVARPVLVDVDDGAAGVTLAPTTPGALDERARRLAAVASARLAAASAGAPATVLLAPGHYAVHADDETLATFEVDADAARVTHLSLRGPGDRPGVVVARVDGRGVLDLDPDAPPPAFTRPAPHPFAAPRRALLWGGALAAAVGVAFVTGDFVCGAEYDDETGPARETARRCGRRMRNGWIASFSVSGALLVGSAVLGYLEDDLYWSRAEAER